MSSATYVALVPAPHRDRLRQILTAEDTGPLSWREDRKSKFSEFYFCGPPALARKTHTYVANWLMRRRLA